MTDQMRELGDAIEEFRRSVIAVLERWGVFGFIVRMLLVAIAVEIVFVLIPWLATR